MKCKAIAVRTNAPCQNEAEADGYCRLPAHKRQAGMLADLHPRFQALFDAPSTEPSTEPSTPPSTPPSTEPSTPPPPVDTPVPTWDLPAELTSLPRASHNVVDEIADAIGARGGPQLAILEAAAERHLEDPDLALGEPENAAAVDDAAVERDRDGDAGSARAELRAALRGPTPISQATVKRWMRWIVNPIFAAQGKDLLEQDELDEGALLAQEWLEWVRLGWLAETRTGRTVFWMLTVVGFRYADEIFTAFANAGRWAKRRVLGLPALPASSAPNPPRSAPIPSPQEVAAAATVEPERAPRSSEPSVNDLHLTSAGWGG